MKMVEMKFVISKQFFKKYLLYNVHSQNNILSPYLTSMYYKMLANKPMYFMSTTRNVDENGKIDKSTINIFTRGLGALPAPTSIHLFTITYSPSPIHHHLLTTTYSPPPIHHRLFTITYSPSPIHHRLFTIAYSPSPIHRLTSRRIMQFQEQDRKL